MNEPMTTKEQISEGLTRAIQEQVGNGQELKSELAVAFNMFNQSTQRLEQAYVQLQERVKDIDREMELTNERLKRKVEELDDMTRYLNNILESMHSGVVAIDLNGKVTTLNRVAEEILNIDASEAKGKDCSVVIKNVSGVQPLLLKALRDGKNSFDLEHEILTKDNKVRLVESSISLLRDTSENVVGAVEVFRDVTELRDLKEQLHKADKLATIGKLAATVAHEIRNPLNGIEGFASLLARDFDNGDPRRRLVKNIINGTKSLNKTITDLLIFAKPIKLDLVKSNVSEMLDNAIYFATMEMQQKNIKNIHIVKDFKAQVANITCDPGQLQQVLLNLFLNAVQAMPEGGEIKVFTRHEGPQPINTAEWGNCELTPNNIQIGIEDSGVGIKDDCKAKIFDPFFTTKADGTGLGLSIASKIIELHAGWITVQSEMQKGTVFLVNLPINKFKTYPIPNLQTPLVSSGGGRG